MLEQVLHHMKRVLDLGTDAGLGLFLPFRLLTIGRLIQRAPLALPHRDMPGDRCFQVLFTFIYALITCIPERHSFPAMQ